MLMGERWAIIVVILAVLGCESEAVAPLDAAGARDGGPAPEDSGRTDETCPDGEHRCDDQCIDDLPNDPANGCSAVCGEPAACPAPEGGRATCTLAGSCTFNCMAPYERRDDNCVCVPRTCDSLGFECGEGDDGCGGPLDCGTCDEEAAVCSEDNVCFCESDDGEPNQNRLQADGAEPLATLRDNPDADRSWTIHNFHSVDDNEDWFRINIDDRGLAGGAPPDITVDLTGIPEGSDYDLRAYFTCNEGENDTDCDLGIADNELGRGCASTNDGSDDERVVVDAKCGRELAGDDGVLYVRIQNVGGVAACAPYTLRVRVR